jgi:hypothetical protein
MHLVLRDGFHGHSVIITMNGKRVYEAAGVTTDPVTVRAGVVALRMPVRTARVGVSVTPGDLAGAFDVDITVHPHVAISLVGDSTLAFETSRVPFR